jgi:hypothetical protein
MLPTTLDWLLTMWFAKRYRPEGSTIPAKTILTSGWSLMCSTTGLHPATAWVARRNTGARPANIQVYTSIFAGFFCKKATFVGSQFWHVDGHISIQRRLRSALRTVTGAFFSIRFIRYLSPFTSFLPYGQCSRSLRGQWGKAFDTKF